MIAVFGSGFGLYGHLPAIVELGRPVSVPSRYRTAFLERAELKAYRYSVHFVEEDAGLLSKAELAVLVRRPGDNRALAREAMRIGHPLQLVIEKPLAPTPAEAVSLASALRAAGVRHATPYLLPHCDWAQECKKNVTAGLADSIQLDWHHHAAHIGESWKTLPEEGGGALSYYFIHVLALAAFLISEFRVVDYSASEERSACRVAMAATDGHTRFAATFSAGSDDARFSIACNGTACRTATTPFGTIPGRGTRDPRIEILKRFYATEVFSATRDRASEMAEAQTLAAWRALAQCLQPRSAAAPAGSR